MLYPRSIPCAPRPNTFPNANAALSPSLLSSAAAIARCEPTAPLNFAFAAAVPGAVAMAASAEPAVRALRIDPLAALRHE